jgi:DNA-binding transcriptional LysR family regulator
MDANDLAIFEVVARTGGITRAAQELAMVQSNVTRRVRNLERDLGVPLFHRRSRGVALTAAGRTLLPYAGGVSRLLTEARRAVQEGADPSGSLTIGSLETTAAVRLPPMLVVYHRAYPNVDVSLHTGTAATLIADVLEYRLEGAFVAGPVDHPALLEEPIVTENLVVVTAPTWPTLDALTAGGDAKVLVFRIGCAYRQRLEEVLTRRGVATIRRLEFGTLDGIIGCVAAGLGLTLLPEASVASAKRAGAVATHPLPDGEGLAQTVFIRRRDQFVSSALTRFLECAHRSVRDLRSASWETHDKQSHP